MSAVGEVEVAAKPAEEHKPDEEKKPAKERRLRAPKAPKEKKPREKMPKASAPSHPPYFQMIKEAIMALDEKTGSSSHAIAKYVEEKHKGELPANFKKMLAIQLRNFAGKGKLVKVRASFKLSESEKKETKPAPLKEKKPKEAGTKRKGSSDAAAPKKKAVGAKKASKPAAAKARKAGVGTKAKRAAPVKPRQPKSIKSPVTKRARRATAAA